MFTVNSIKELRQTCQKDIKGKDVWSWYQIQRTISIRFTRYFIRIGASANQVQIFSLLISLSGAYFFFTTNYMIGFLLYQLHFILDCCDGELARYYGTVSYIGLFQDRLMHMISEPILFISLAIGLGNIGLGIIPALCCENGLRLIIWGYETSRMQESDFKTNLKHRNQPFFEKVARFFAVYGFIWLVLSVSFLGKDWLVYLLIFWSVWTLLACIYHAVVRLAPLWKK